jgi:CRISPR-associated protein Cas5d
VFLGTRDCQGYVERCEFGSGKAAYDGDGELQYGLMFHSFDYPDETGENRLAASFWRPKLVDGVLTFPRPDDLTQIVKKDIRAMSAKRLGLEQTLQSVDEEFSAMEAATGGLA